MEVVENSIRCPVCNKIKDKNFRRFNGVFYCDRHYRQLKKYGKTVITIFDKNDFIDNGEYIKIKLKYCDLYTILDKEDYFKVKNYSWRFHNGYAVTKINGVTTYIQDLILPSDKTVDHIIKENTLDNRKSNLRIATKSQNMMNSKTSVRNTSGAKGVSWIKKRHKWRASIHLNGKTHNLGYFTSKKEAIQKRLDYEAEFFKEFSSLYNKENERLELICDGEIFYSYIKEEQCKAI